MAEATSRGLAVEKPVGVLLHSKSVPPTPKLLKVIYS